MKIIFLGAPGAGKGTQAAAVSKELNIPTISTGNLIREAIASGSPVGLKTKDVIAKGQLVSDEIVVEIVKEKLKTIDGGYIQDGFPRTVAQAEALEAMPEVVVRDLEHIFARTRDFALGVGKALLDHFRRIGAAAFEPGTEFFH